MRALYYPALDERETYSITGDALHHLAKVIRISPGEEVLLLDGKGLGVVGKVESISKKELILSCLKTIRQEQKINLALALGIPKKEALELCLKEATELGFRKMYLIRSAYSQTRIPEPERVKSLLVSAMEQANSFYLPEVCESRWEELPFADYGHSLLLDSQTEASQNTTNESKNSAALLIVGPEGGFSPEELDYLRKAPQVESMRLPTPILRTPTAVATGAGILLGRLLN